MRILEDYTSQYTSKERIDHQTFQSPCRDHHQLYRQVLEMTIYTLWNQEVGTI